MSSSGSRLPAATSPIVTSGPCWPTWGGEKRTAWTQPPPLGRTPVRRRSGLDGASGEPADEEALEDDEDEDDRQRRQGGHREEAGVIGAELIDVRREPDRQHPLAVVV